MPKKRSSKGVIEGDLRARGNDLVHVEGGRTSSQGGRGGEHAQSEEPVARRGCI